MRDGWELPVDGTGHLRRDRRRVLLHLVRRLAQADQLLHQVDGAVLRVAVVQHFYGSGERRVTTIEDFVHHGELVAEIVLCVMRVERGARPCSQCRSSS